MPQIPLGHVHAHPHVGGNQDAWPLSSDSKSIEQREKLVENYKEEMRQALASGINGFQMLTFVRDEVFVAAEEIYDESGEVFYVAPEWCGIQTEEEALDRIVGFARKYADHPSVFQLNGRPVHFFYGNPGPWSSSNDKIRSFQEKLSERGVDVILVPTKYFFAATALGRRDLRTSEWTEEDLLNLPEPKWLQETAWEGATDFVNTSPQIRGLLDSRLKEYGQDFLWVPSLRSGYDSSNRPGQAVHTRFNGMITLWENLKFWIENGYRQITYVTWNDVLESALVPSSRNVWGYNTLVRYWHGIAEDGRSPFDEDQVVVCYPTDVLLGDDFYFQLAVMTADEGSWEVRAKVELIPVDGGEPVVFEMSHEAVGSSTLVETRLDTSDWLDTTAFQPRVSVEMREASEGRWRQVYDRVSLGMTRVRYNIAHYLVPYAVNLGRVSQASELQLKVHDYGPLERVVVDVRADSSIRRMALIEGTQSLGMFRLPESGSKDRASSHEYQDVYLRLEASKDLPVRLSLENGLIHDLYSPHWTFQESVVPIDSDSAVFSSRPEGSFRTRVARVSLNASSKIHFELKDQPTGEGITTDLEELAQGLVAEQIGAGDDAVTLTLTLTTDATDPNIDFPLPASGQFSRDLSLLTEINGVRTLQALAWLESGDVAYSPPVSIEPNDQTTSMVEWIDTNGSFYDFLAYGSSESINAFTADDVRSGKLKRSRIPYFHIDFEEGAGPRLNDRGTSQELGRAWLENPGGRGNGHLARYDWDENRYEWIPGVSGNGIRFQGTGGIRFRSKSSPFGAVTVSLWVHVSNDSGAAGEAVFKSLSAEPFSLTIEDGEVTVSMSKAGHSIELPPFGGLRSGWNHLVFSYDLHSVSAYLGGELKSHRGEVLPLYQRTHQVPFVGFSDPSDSGLGFDGGLDEIQVIGTGLSDAEIKGLSAVQAWRPVAE